MTTLENRPNTALIVIDVQNGVVAGAHERDAVVANIAGLVDRARREQVPVVWVQHFDEDLPRGSASSSRLANAGIRFSRSVFVIGSRLLRRHTACAPSGWPGQQKQG